MKKKEPLKEERQYLNEFHKRSTEALQKEVEAMSKQPFSREDFEEQVKRIQPNGKHKQRKF